MYFTLAAIFLGVMTVVSSGVISDLPEDQVDQVLALYHQACGETSGYGGGSLPDSKVHIVCKEPREYATPQDKKVIRVPPQYSPIKKQVIFVQVPPNHFNHQITLVRDPNENKKTKIYVLPQDAQHQIQVHDNRQVYGAKPQVFFLGGNPLGGYPPNVPEYGPPQGPPNGEYGPPVQSPPPQGPPGEYGPPSQVPPPQMPPSSEYGPPSQGPPSSEYGPPSQGPPSSEYGPPPQAPQGPEYGPPAQSTQSQYGPPSQNPPQPPSSEYGGPPPPQAPISEYGGPPPQPPSSEYGGPPPQTPASKPHYGAPSFRISQGLYTVDPPRLNTLSPLPPGYEVKQTFEVNSKPQASVLSASPSIKYSSQLPSKPDTTISDLLKRLSTRLRSYRSNAEYPRLSNNLSNANQRPASRFLFPSESQQTPVVTPKFSSKFTYPVRMIKAVISNSTVIRTPPKILVSNNELIRSPNKDAESASFDVLPATYLGYTYVVDKPV